MTATQVPARRDSAVVFLLILVWFSATAWARPLMLPDEGRYVGVAWEMLRSGDWFTPTLDGLPFFHKPPLFYWLTAGSLAFFGVSELAARMAAILGATAGAFALYWYVSRHVSRRIARMTLLVLLTQPLYFGGGQFANLDMLVAGCICATVLLAACAAENAYLKLPFHRELGLAYLCAALGVLAKGLIGMVLPVLIIVIWLAMLKRGRTILSMIWWPGILLFGIVVAPWFVSMQSQYPEFLHYFFVVQHFNRYAQGGFNNVQPMWFYPVVLAVLTLPWFAWLYRTCARSYWGNVENRPTRVLMWIWVVVVVVFFSVPQSKVIGYILPAIPPLSFIVADCANSIGDASSRARKLWWGSATIAIVICVGIVVALTLKPVKTTRDIAYALKAQRVFDEPVFFIDRYYYDVAFYAGLRTPAQVVEDWTNPDIAKNDNWRRELVEAARFSPYAATTTLLTPAAMRNFLCRTPMSWVIAPTMHAARHSFLIYAKEIIRDNETVLFKLDSSSPALASVLQCPKKPNDDSTNK